jgi:sulfate transport system substrate-binding protein
MNRLFVLLLLSTSALAQDKLLNVSYDPTRELYQDLNAAFVKSWKASSGRDVTVNQSHGGSGKQARSVIDGLDADVVTLGLAGDIDAIAEQAKLLPAGWQARLPNNSTPWTSTIVLVVRKGNPKGIKDWDDLVKPGVLVVTPNPKTSGGARWNYLAAWGWALKKYGDEAKAKEFIGKLYGNVPVLDSGARGATTTFSQRRIGHVMIAWENEALLLLEQSRDAYEIVAPSLTIVAEPPVALLDKSVDKHGTRAVAEAYLKFLYSEEAQHLGAKRHFRPTVPSVLAAHQAEFPKVTTFTIGEVFGGWKDAQKKHFAEGGIFEQIYTAGK